MNVSVIIPTYNGAHKLPKILSCLTKQSVQPNEIIVVVDGSNDNTDSVLKAQQALLPHLKCIFQLNKGRSVVRNTGAENATNELLIFFDDDMLPDDTCIEKHIRHHQFHKDSIMTGGQVDYLNSQSSEIQQFKRHLSEKWLQPLKKFQNLPMDSKVLFLTAANFSISRALFFKLEGFDPTLNDAEDFDLAVKAFKSGAPLFFNYTAFAWHDDQITAETYIKRLRQYSSAHKVLIKNKPWMVEEGYLKPPSEPKGFKQHIFKIFCSRTWVDAIDNGSLKALPRRIRFKLYDLIVTANGVYYPEKVMF